VTADFAVVIPTIGRESLQRLLSALDSGSGPVPSSVVVVDDRPSGTAAPIVANATRLPVTVVESGGRGPAAARNVGWRRTQARWVCFLDDDVLPGPDWLTAVTEDLADAEARGAAGSQAVLDVPVPAGRPATDDERRTQRLEAAQWITADMAYRRDVLVGVGGFDERFPRAYREDSDLALRITLAGNTIAQGKRRTTHPVAPPTLMASVRAQRGNADNALLRRKFGSDWRRAVGEGPGRMPAHVLTTAAAVAAVLGAARGRWRIVELAGLVWFGLTAHFTVLRYRNGPRTLEQAGRLALTSALIPPAAVFHRLRGEWRFRTARRDPPLAVLLDRDDTIIADGPYLRDPAGVRPLPGAVEALNRLRQSGLKLAVVTNQSGVAKGLISPEDLAAVNARVEELLGPFDSWQMCLHDDGDGCTCRKPAAGMVLAAAEELGVDPARCVMIGDTGGDVQAALSARAHAVLVPTGRTLPDEVDHAHAHASVAPTLSDAVALVLRECR
jgi:histidinol-phosphate phosphatase family protein